MLQPSRPSVGDAIGVDLGPDDRPADLRKAFRAIEQRLVIQCQ